MLDIFVTVCIAIALALWVALMVCAELQIPGVSEPGCKTKRKR